MRYVIGIDVGGSTTKICAFTEEGQISHMISPMFVRANDPVTSAYGAFGKFTSEHKLNLSQINQVMITGVGSGSIEKNLYQLPCISVPEFKAVGLGGLFLSGLDRAIVVSMGTGTAVVYAEKGKVADYLGGTGVGGGTILGLSKLLLKMDSIEHLQAIAAEGDLGKINLTITDITARKTLSEINPELTAANFGKVSDLASKSDIALGIFNMVFETIAMISLFAARSHGLRDIVLTGNLAEMAYAAQIFPQLSAIFGVHFIIPKLAQFATVIGTALSGLQNQPAT
ncbi:MAG: type II pantothenate kinase [Eubacteriales bacterium]